MAQSETASAFEPRLPLVDALRAIAASMITWHHIASYGPLSYVATPRWAISLLWNFSWSVQVFFVIGGYMLARTMSARTWNGRRIAQFVVRRYCRLGLPYLATIVLSIAARDAARGWLPARVVDDPPTWDQILAHVFFLQDILGYDSLSAGFWYVCISFQLGVVFVAMPYLRDVLAGTFGLFPGERSDGIVVLMGWILAVPALFVFDEHFDVWAVYFFGQFFLGVMLYYGLASIGFEVLFVLYAAMMAAALVYEWEWRLATALATGLFLFLAGKRGWMQRWPAGPLLARLGLTSYSLFLVHFPVIVIVSMCWVRLEFESLTSAVAASIVAYFASLVVAEVFYRAVEAPAARLRPKLG